MSKSEISRSSLIEHFNASILSGIFFLIGGVQWFFGILAAESWHDGYSSRIDYVSELGIGPTALIFNLSVFILGAFIVIGAFFLYKSSEKKLLPLFLMVTGIGCMGVGVFPGYLQPMHSIATMLAIMFGALAAMVSYSHQTRPMSIVSLVLGSMSLVLSIIFIPYLGLPTGSTETFLGMAKGSLERWAIYPILSWITAFGGYLMGSAASET